MLPRRSLFVGKGGCVEKPAPRALGAKSSTALRAGPARSRSSRSDVPLLQLTLAPGGGSGGIGSRPWHGGRGLPRLLGRFRSGQPEKSREPPRRRSTGGVQPQTGLHQRIRAVAASAAEAQHRLGGAQGNMRFAWDGQGILWRGSWLLALRKIWFSD